MYLLNAFDFNGILNAKNAFIQSPIEKCHSFRATFAIRLYSNEFFRCIPNIKHIHSQGDQKGAMWTNKSICQWIQRIGKMRIKRSLDGNYWIKWMHRHKGVDGEFCKYLWSLVFAFNFPEWINEWAAITFEIQCASLSIVYFPFPFLFTC